MAKTKTILKEAFIGGIKGGMAAGCKAYWNAVPNLCVKIRVYKTVSSPVMCSTVGMIYESDQWY
jgi:hypothetical protein